MTAKDILTFLINQYCIGLQTFISTVNISCCYKALFKIDSIDQQSCESFFKKIANNSTLSLTELMVLNPSHYVFKLYN